MGKKTAILSPGTFEPKPPALPVARVLVYDYTHRRPRFIPEPLLRANPTSGRRGKMAEKIVHITDDTFESEVLQSQTPVLVDYWAEWCGPCKMIAPALDQIAKEYEGRLTVAKLNIDENPVTPPKYSVRGIPTLMLFKNGSLEAQKVGALSKTQLAAFIDSNI